MHEALITGCRRRATTETPLVLGMCIFELFIFDILV